MHQFGQHLTHPFNFLNIAFFRETLAYAVKRVGQAILIHRLHQIIDGLRFKSANGMIAISGHEDEKWRLDYHPAPYARKSADTGHLFVVENTLRLIRFKDSKNVW